MANNEKQPIEASALLVRKATSAESACVWSRGACQSTLPRASSTRVAAAQVPHRLCSASG